MRAVRFDRYGDVNELRVSDAPDPVAGAGQVVVSVRAAGINPGEAKIREGALHDQWPATFPEGQGSDFAGVVDSVGPGVSGLTAGDEVFGFTNERASQAERVLAQADEVVAKPTELGWATAGALFVAGTSAYALVQSAAVGPSDVVVVSGAAGGVGSLTVQWARLTGATVVGLAGPANHDWLSAHDVVPVDYHGDGLPDRIRAAVGHRPVTALLDTYGPPYVDLALELGVAPERIATIADFGAAEQGAQVVYHFAVATPEVLTALGEAAADGRLEVPIAATYPLDEVREAYRLLESGHTHGKIVLLPGR